MVFLRRKWIPYARENGKLIGQYIFTLFFIGLGIWFMRHEEAELHQVQHILSTSNWEWLIVGVLLVFVYIALQGGMYIESFAAMGCKVSFYDSVVLFLKRNFISVFLPAGGISSLAFFAGPIAGKGVSKSQIHFASSIYAFVGIVSVILVAIPAFLLALAQGSIGAGEWMALVTLLLFVGVIYLLYNSILNKGIIYKKLILYAPSVEASIADLQSNKINKRHFFYVVVYSILIELTGIAHVYIAMLALGLQPSLLAATIGYIVAVIFLIASPFLRGLGAIEVSMSYILIRFGYNDVVAISITFFYRFFEFWLPLFVGAMSFLLKINRLLMRVFPALLLLVLGLVNIVSVLTPAVGQRLTFLKDFLPIGAITVSNYFVFITGLLLLVTAAFMLKGLRMAWYFALFFCMLSIVGNLTKAMDYEEAIFASCVLGILLISRKEYYIRNNRRLGIIGLQTTLLTSLAVLLYGCVGFYYLDQKHFNIDFSWRESVRYTIQNFLLVGSEDLLPNDDFARDFLYSLNICGFVCIAFLVYTLVRPYLLKASVEDDDLAWAKQQMTLYGNSGMDYFKAYADKLIFRSENSQAFIAYRITGNFAVVLECPVGPKDQLRACIEAFEKYCSERGLKSLYYRVPEEKLTLFPNKRKLFLGQEAVLDLNSFSLDGGSKKSIRNALKKVSEKGYYTKIYAAPINDHMLDRLGTVSHEWLKDTGRSEIVFSQGMFLPEELEKQTIITVEDSDEKIVAFLNIIPDYAPGEGTYDLIRKTSDAPNGVIDFIIVALFNYLKREGFDSCNLGFAPLSGIANPQNFPERSMKFAYEKIRTFSHYKGLRDFKEKFSPVWYNKYLIYDQDYDLFKVPTTLANVIKP